jgi:hypothetical protein
MCALLSSKLLEESRQSYTAKKEEEHEDIALEKVKRSDRELCTQYTLTALNCEGVEGEIGKDPGGTRSLTIPVAFCGIHNPMREPSFYGMYPGGRHTDTKNAIVPPLKTPQST